jgi:hypothetical protein
MLKACGYLVSTVSVALLGLAAWPGAEKAGLVPFLVAGMLTSAAGMALRWISHVLDGRRARPQTPDLSRQMRFDAEQGGARPTQEHDGLTYLRPRS